MKMFLNKYNQIAMTLNKVLKVKYFENEPFKSYWHIKVTFEIDKQKYINDSNKMSAVKIPIPLITVTKTPTVVSVSPTVPTLADEVNSKPAPTDYMRSLLAPNTTIIYENQHKQELWQTMSDYIIRVATNQDERVKIANELHDKRNLTHSTALYNTVIAFIQSSGKNSPEIQGISTEHALAAAQNLAESLQLLGCVDTSPISEH